MCTKVCSNKKQTVQVKPEEEDASVSKGGGHNRFICYAYFRKRSLKLNIYDYLCFLSQLHVACCRLQALGCRLQVAGSRLQIAGCRLKVSELREKFAC